MSNPVADMQLFVAQEIRNGILLADDVLQTGVNTISDVLIEWARDGTVLDPYYRCNGDSMHHVGKGIVVIRVEDTINFLIRNNVSSSLSNVALDMERRVNGLTKSSTTVISLGTPLQTITNIENLSVEPFLNCNDFHSLASFENPEVQQMGNVRGISVASFRSNAEVNGIKSFNIVEGNTITTFGSTFSQYKTIGIDVQGVSDGILMQENVIDLVAGPGPVDDPQVMGIRVSAECLVSLV